MTDIFLEVERVEQEQYHSIPAQRLIEKLSLLKNRKESARKRWFWELLQNASDYNEIVSVKVVVTDHTVEFLHNGSPFSIRDAYNLIAPDSNKRDDEKHIDNIGKFGTGLVSTHILSSVIKVNGICVTDKDNELYSFDLTLDRSSFIEKSALIDSIKETKLHFKESLTKVDICEDYSTSFLYDIDKTLPTLEPLNSADIDLEYLYEMLPYTLCFMPKVQCVHIVDIRKERYEFRITRKSVSETDILFEVCKGGESTILNFKYFKHNDVSTAFLVDGGHIVPYPNEISRIFCGLPLIGTEDAGLPIIVNSFLFEPTTEREGIELEPGSNELNRRLMNDTVVLYSKVLQYVEQERLLNAYILSNIRKKYNGTQASKTQFYNIYLPHYRKALLEHAIVPNYHGEFITFAQTRLPFRESKVDMQLFQNFVMIASNNLPSMEDYTHWFEVIDFTIFPDQKYTLEHLSVGIEGVGSVYAFSQDSETVISWLIECCKYFKEYNRYIFSQKKLLPNQAGKFCNCMELKSDDNLPLELKNIYNQLYDPKGKKIENELLNPSFDSLEIVNQLYSVELLARNIDSELAEQYSKNQGNTSSIIQPINALYSWMSACTLNKTDLASWFHWYYPKRATLIVDMLTESQREQALTIAQSGKMEALAELASSNLSNEELARLAIYKDRLSEVFSLLLHSVDDKTYANANTGNTGEEIVYNDLLMKYPKRDGYEVIWTSKESDEPCYDFEIRKSGLTICYCDAKTTQRGIANADSIPFFMRRSQWNFLSKLDDNIPYYIARVFQGDNGKIIYLQVKMN